MATFQKTKLGDVIEIYNGKAIKAEPSGAFPVYGSNGKIGFSPISSYSDAIILGRVGAYCGSVMIEKDEFWASDNTIVIKNNKNTDPSFLYFLLKHLNLNQYAGGAAQPLITHTLLKQINISVPDLPTQTHIASVLSTYDDLIENNEKRIKALEEMAQLLYTEWFVKFKFPGHKKVKMVDSGTEYGKIPQGWGVKNLLDSKTFLPCKNRIKKFEGEKLYFDTSCIDGIKITKEPLIVRWETIPSRAQFAPIYTSVWFARMSNTYKVLVFDKSSSFEISNYLLSSGMFGLATEEKYLGFLFALIKSEAFHKQKDSKATGATQVSLTDEGFAAIRVLFPSFELIEKYSNLVNENIRQILSLQRQNKNLSKTRDLLITQLVTGKRELK